MGWRYVAIVLAALLAMPATGPGTAPGQSTGDVQTATASRGMAAIDKAARGGRYLFVYFWKENDEQAQKMYAVFQTAMKGPAGSADSVAVQIADPNEKTLIDRYGVSRAPMPLVIAIAPNGAVTKGFPVRFTDQDLRTAFVSPCTARCMKGLQDRKLVLLCVLNQQTQFGEAAWQGVQAFKADTRFAQSTELVPLDPSDPNEAGFLQALQIDPGTPQAVTVLLAPPGQPVARFAGAVSKDQLVAKLVAARSNPCAGGKCGPGGCGPKR